MLDDSAPEETPVHIFQCALRLMADPSDEDACLGCFPPQLWEPHQRSHYAAAKRHSSFIILDYLRRTSKSQKLKNRLNVLDKLHQAMKVNEVNLPCFVNRFLQGFGLKKGTKRTIDGMHNDGPTQTADDLEQMAQRWHSQRMRNYNATLAEQLSQFSDTLRDNDAAPRSDISIADSVFVGTIHKSKGQEFEVVFVLDVSEENFGGCSSERPSSTVDDERRLLFVAASRAKKSLYILFTGVYNVSTQRNRLSSFLKTASGLACVRLGHFPPTDGASGKQLGQGDSDTLSAGEKRLDCVINFDETIRNDGNIEKHRVTAAVHQSLRCAVNSLESSQRVVRAKSEAIGCDEISQPKCVSFFSYTKKS